MTLITIIFFSLILLTFILILTFIYLVFNGFVLNRYLKQNYYSEWNDMTSVGNWGPGLVIPGKGKKSLNKLSLKDSSIKRHEKKIYKLWKVVYVIFFLLMINLCVLIGIGYYLSRTQ